MKRPNYVTCSGPEWEKTRMRVLVRDDFTCQFAQLGLEPIASCTHEEPEARLRKLQVHHIQARINGGTHNLENLITLCVAHHTLIHPHMLMEFARKGSREFPRELPER